MNSIHIKIYTNLYCINIANNLKQALKQHYKVPCTVYGKQFDKIDRDMLGIHEYVIIFLGSLSHTPFKYPPPPYKYILYQLEQLNKPKVYLENIHPILSVIQQSIYTFDYSQTNLKYYPENIKYKIRYLLPPVNQNIILKLYPIYDVLFFGVLTPRRVFILNYLIEKGYIVHTVEKVVGNKLCALIKRSRVVLNLHNMNEPILEIPRLHEAIHTSVRIISENPCIEDMNTISIDMKERIYFIEEIKEDLSNISLLIEAIEISSKEKESCKVITNYLDVANKKVIESLKPIQFIKFPGLFHKYILGLANPNDSLNYDIQLVKGKIHERQYIAHLHCYDITLFGEIYDEYITNLSDIFGIIITYCIGEKSIEDMIDDMIDDVVILKTENRGMDIGGKFCAVHYLNKNNSLYEHILFLHSKSDPISRREMFDPLIGKDNLPLLKKQMLNHDGIFPNCRLNGDWNTGKWALNRQYVDQLSEYLNIKPDTKFIFGNIGILSRRVVNHIFGDSTILYNLLNTQTSFDYNWYCCWYYKKEDIIYQGDNYLNIPKLIVAWNKCHSERLIPNNNQLSRKYSKFSNKKFLSYPFQLRDGMIEHAFERIYVNVITALGGKYKILYPAIRPILHPIRQKPNINSQLQNISNLYVYNGFG